MKLIDKDPLVAEIKRRQSEHNEKKYGYASSDHFWASVEDEKILSFIDTLEVIDPYEQCIQYASIESGIKAHAEDYSFNIESLLFNQLTKEQQTLWRKEIEQAVISGGYSGLNLAKDPRYKENLEVKEVDLKEEYKNFVEDDPVYSKLVSNIVGMAIAKHFFELGLKVQKGE